MMRDSVTDTGGDPKAGRIADGKARGIAALRRGERQGEGLPAVPIREFILKARNGTINSGDSETWYDQRPVKLTEYGTKAKEKSI